MLLVTGASGQLGKATIQYAKAFHKDLQIAGMVRTEKARAELQELGIDSRIGDYTDYQSLVDAFQGVEKVLLISAPAFTDLAAQHKNVIDAAKQAGVKHIVYTSILRSPEAANLIPWVTEANIFTESYLRESGLAHTILQNTFYADNLPYFLGKVFDTRKINVPAGDGKISFATRDNLAEATARVLTQEGHESATYTLTGTERYSFADIATVLSQQSGTEIGYDPDNSPEQFIKQIAGDGFPEFLASFWVSWSTAFKSGDLDLQSDDLKKLLGRKPDSLEDFFLNFYQLHQV